MSHHDDNSPDALAARTKPMSEDHARFARVREMFDRVSDLPPAQAHAALQTSDLDSDDRAAVVRLLDGHRKHRLFGVTAATWAKELDGNDDVAESLLGKRVGTFEIVRFVGRGGSAVVFQARRSIGQAEQTVALKILDSGGFSPEARRRFRREQAILSRLTHPNIARLIEAGIADFGSPFIAMEFVEGVDIGSFAAAQSLDRKARLHLLIDTCRAVDAAHRLLIVHRDLKPSNVLVTADGRVKVLDFGIAKLVDDTDLQTATQHIALTPAYAAPEQFHAGPAATSMDVFSLGVLASELLLGGRLGADATLPAGDTTGTWPNWRKLDTDLAHILRAALASEPRRRYSSAGHMADDFERYLRREPIQIVPLSQGYRLRKFVSRHRRGVAAAALVSMTALVGAIGIVYQASVAQEQAQLARQQATLAQQHAERASEVRDFLVSVFKAGGADLPRDQRPSVDDIVEKASKRLLSDEHFNAPLREDLLLTLADVASSIDSFDRAGALLDKVESLSPLLGNEASEAYFQVRVRRAGIEIAQSTWSGAKALEWLQPIVPQLEARHDAIAVNGRLYQARALQILGRNEEAFAIARDVVNRAVDDEQPELVFTAIVMQTSLAVSAQHYPDAIQYSQTALDYWHRHGEPLSPNLINLYGRIAVAKESAGDMTGAEAAYLAAIATAERFYDRPALELAETLQFYASFLISRVRADEAEPYLKRALQMNRDMWGDDDPRLAHILNAMSRLESARYRFEEAAQWMTRAIDLSRRNHVHSVVLARSLGMRSHYYAMLHKFDLADTDIRDALTEQKSISGDDNPGYALIMDLQLDLQVREHRYEEAVRTADRALAIDAKVGGGLLQSVLITRYNRARALLELDHAEEALSQLLDVEPAYATLAPKGPYRFDMLATKSFALEKSARLSEAKTAAREALALAAPTSDKAWQARLHRLVNSTAP